MRYTIPMLDVVSTIFWGLLLLTAVIFIHEVGHFSAARAFGLRVKEFMIGLPGPKLFFKRHDTRYGVTAIPLGGYCLIAGMEKGEEGSELEKALALIAYFGTFSEDQAQRASEALGIDLIQGLDTLADWGTVYRFRAKGLYHYMISAATIKGVSYKEGQPRQLDDIKGFLAAERELTYVSKPWWKRIVMLLAGSFSNLVVAMAILISLLMVMGAQSPSTTIDRVVEGSPAEAAGLVAGDQLAAINDDSFDTWEGFIEALEKHTAGERVTLAYNHEGTRKIVVLNLGDSDGNPMLGVVAAYEREPISILKAAQVSVSLVGMTLAAILQLFNPATFSETIGQTSSVVGISIEASNAAANGPVDFIVLIAALSISIGFMNLLPIPPLDGGKIIIETIERLAHRRLPVSIVNGISIVGFAAMILLFIVATNADIHRYFLGG